MVDPGIKNFFTNNTKYYIFLLLGFLVIFVISIVNAVDFRKIAVQNDEISDTYFGVTYANVLCGLNIVLAILVFAAIVYVSIKILKGSKELRDLETDLEVYRLTQIAKVSASKSAITPDIFMKTTGVKTVPTPRPVPAPAPAPVRIPVPTPRPVPAPAPDFFSAFGIPAGLSADVEGFNSSGVRVNELKEVARLSGVDINTYANSCSDGNKELKCNPLTGNDVNLNSLYNKFYE
jgi:uncharacterized membrane protein YciS (DUF1049 family)